MNLAMVVVTDNETEKMFPYFIQEEEIFYLLLESQWK